MQLSGLQALKVSNIYAPFATLAQYKGFKLFIFVETQYTLKLNLLQRTNNNSGPLIPERSIRLSLTCTRPPVLSLTAWSYRSEVVGRRGLKRRNRIYFGFYLQFFFYFFLYFHIFHHGLGHTNYLLTCGEWGGTGNF